MDEITRAVTLLVHRAYYERRVPYPNTTVWGTAHYLNETGFTFDLCHDNDCQSWTRYERFRVSPQRLTAAVKKVESGESIFIERGE